MPISPPASSPLNRIGPLRSRRGCKTCKIRKVKCGEEKPSCRRCITSGFKCEYSSPSSHSFASAPPATSILDRPPSASPNTVWRERRAFAYYFQHAAPYLAGGLDLEFWGSVVPQMCRTEPAVWDAVNAISTLFERPDMCSDPVFLSLRHEKSPVLNQYQSEALGWYARALSKIQTQIDRRSVDAHVALISCVLFVCIETLQGHVEEALQLYNQGIKLILSLRADTCAAVPGTKASLLENTVIPLFLRLGTVALTISGVPVCDLFNESDFNGDYNFTSLDSARAALIPLAAETLILQHEAGSNPFIGVEMPVSPDLVRRRNRLQERLGHWYQGYTTFTQTQQEKRSSFHLNASVTAILLTYYTTLVTILATLLALRETVYDAYLDNFRIIVQQARIALDSTAGPDGTQPAFTFEMGVGLPLYWTSLKCRERSLRREALELLRKAPRMQGFYKCTPGATLAAKIMELEEGFSRNDPQTTEPQQSELNGLLTPPGEDTGTHETTIDISEDARIVYYCVFRPRDQPWLAGPHDITEWKRGPDQLFLRYTRNQRNSEDETVWYLADECVPIDY